MHTYIIYTHICMLYIFCIKNMVAKNKDEWNSLFSDNISDKNKK